MRITEISEPFHSMPYRASGRGEIRYNELPFYFAYVKGLPDDIDCIVVTSDLQGREQDEEKNRLLGEAVSEELVELQRNGIIPKAEVLISVGDLFDSPTLSKLGSSGDVTSVLNSFSQNFKYVLAVHGNHDMVTNAELERNVQVLDGTAINHQGLTIGGVCGIMGKETKLQRKSPENFMKLLKGVTSKRPDILLLHQSPRGSEEKQIGDKISSEFFQTNGSSLVIAGHCHWETHTTTLGRNQVLNTDSKVFILKRKD